MKHTFQISLLNRGGELQKILFNSSQTSAQTAFYALVNALAVSDYSRATFGLVTPSKIEILATCQIPWRG